MKVKSIPTLTVLHYRKDLKKNFSSVSHYNAVDEVQEDILSEKLNISKNRNCAKSKPMYWLKKWEKSKWSKWLTGLFPTDSINWYFGDLENKKHLVLFHFNKEGLGLTVYLFKNFYAGKDFIKLFIEQKKKGGV